MRDALLLLAASGSRGFVRTWSQWWVVEGEQARARRLGPAHSDPSGLVRFRGSSLSEEESVTVVPTTSIRGLVSRGLLKFAGTKTLVGHNSTPSHSRAEITAAGRAWLASAEARALLGAASAIARAASQ